MTPCRTRLSARQHEAGERLQAGVESIDSALQLGNLLRLNAQTWGGLVAVGVRNAQIGANVEEVILNALQQLVIFLTGRSLKEENPQHGIQFVDGTVGAHARMILGDPRAVP